VAAVLRDTQIAPQIPPQPVRGAVHQPIIAVDRSNSINRGTIYLAYFDTAIGDTLPHTDIYLSSSGDGGTTWSVPRVVNDDTTVNSHFEVRMAVDNTTGVVGLMWYDCRQDPTDGEVQVFTAFTNDAGHSFSINEQVSAAPSDFSASADPNDFLEYNGAAFYNNVFYVSWADNSANPDGPTNIFFNKETINPNLVTNGGTGNGSNYAKYEPNNSSTHPFNLNSVRLPTLLYGLEIKTTDNVDWWKFKIAQTDPCVEIVETVGVGELFMRLYKQNANGTLTQIDQSSVPFSGATQVVHFAVTNTNQQYFLQVYGYNHSAGDYRLAFLP
jgi:hypothetical protein